MSTPDELFDGLCDDATHAVNNVIPQDLEPSQLYRLNDLLTEFIADLPNRGQIDDCND
jgi:hypothetical protein